DRRTDARDDRIDVADRLALVEQLGVAAADADVELQGVEHIDGVSAPAAGLDQRPGAVQRLLPREDHQTHSHSAGFPGRGRRLPSPHFNSNFRLTPTTKPPASASRPRIMRCSMPARLATVSRMRFSFEPMRTSVSTSGRVSLRPEVLRTDTRPS